MGEVAVEVIRTHFEALVAREPGTRLGEDPEDLHDMRVASRRMRAAIALFRDALPARALRIRDELGWASQSLGMVRDLDVQLEQLGSWSKGDPDLDPISLDALRVVLEKERGEARSEMVKVLDSARYRRLKASVPALLSQGPLRRSRLARAPIEVAARDLIRRRYRSMRNAGDRIREGASADEYHRLRIQCKRLRYALEFLSDVYPGRTEPLIRRLVVLQTHLGTQQDADVAIRRLRLLATRSNGSLPASTSFALGMIADRFAQQGHDLRARFPQAYRRVRGRPWKELWLAMKRQPPPRPADR